VVKETGSGKFVRPRVYREIMQHFESNECLLESVCFITECTICSVVYLQGGYMDHFSSGPGIWVNQYCLETCLSVAAYHA
jgi:hypothetical protein